MDNLPGDSFLDLPGDSFLDHRNVVRDALIALLVSPRTAGTVAENKVVQAVYGEATMQPVLNISHTVFAPIVAASTNPTRACFWEIKALFVDGFRPVAEGNAPEQIDKLLHFIGEPKHMLAQTYP